MREPVLKIVMPALVAGIHVLLSFRGEKDVDSRVKPGHDEGEGQARRVRNIASFHCHFGPLGLEPRHVRSPRTPGGLLWTVNGPRCGL